MQMTHQNAIDIGQVTNKNPCAVVWVELVKPAVLQTTRCAIQVYSASQACMPQVTRLYGQTLMCE